MTWVIKVGGRAQDDPALVSAIVRVWTALSGSVVVVHGGGDEVTALQTAFGVPATFVDGRRVTSAKDIEFVRMALSGSANKRLVAALVREGVRAVGISGEDASLLLAAPVDPDRLGQVGRIERVDVSLLRYLLDGGYLPVVSPVSRNVGAGQGPTLNVNGDDAAAAIASALGAAELLLVSDVPGVLRQGRIIPTLTVHDVMELLEDGTAAGGMAAKLQAAIAAVEGGVSRVRAGDLSILTDGQHGTTITLTRTTR